MRRGRYDRDELLARIDLGALLDELSGPAAALGRTSKWHCPVPEHDDIHPSVTIKTDRRGVERWHCWSGGHGGTAIDAIQVARRIGCREAIDELAQRVGASPDEPGRQRARQPLPPRDRVPLHLNVIEYIKTCEQLLWTPACRPVLDYLTGERGLNEKVLRTNRVGADPGVRRLRRVRGLPRGGPAAVFPALSDSGEIAYVQTRYLDPGDGPRYGNPITNLGDNPRHGWVRPVGSAKPAVVICEGFPDAYTAGGAGYPAVAVLGATNANEQLATRINSGIAGRPVIIAFDGDTAGREASTRLSTALAKRGIMVVELPLPSGADLNSWVLAARHAPDLGQSHRPTPHPGIAPAPAISGP